MSLAAVSEDPFILGCGDAALVGVLHRTSEAARRGVIIVVGGPQYRAGSHRQFVLLARALAADGIPVMRFDHRGIGDSEGTYQGFEALDQDIAAAVNSFFTRCPDLTEVVLWGLCDAASAILFYAHTDPRVCGIALLNPWVRTPVSEAQAYLRHYYVQRLRDIQFWRGLLLGQVRFGKAACSFVGVLARRFRIGRGTAAVPTSLLSQARPSLPDRMADGLAKFKGPLLLIISGQDLTAREFDDSVRASRAWQRLLGAARVTRHDLEEADHTFSRRIWHDKVVEWTSRWVRDL